MDFLNKKKPLIKVFEVTRCHSDLLLGDAVCFPPLYMTHEFKRGGGGGGGGAGGVGSHQTRIHCGFASQGMGGGWVRVGVGGWKQTPVLPESLVPSNF